MRLRGGSRRIKARGSRVSKDDLSLGRLNWLEEGGQGRRISEFRVVGMNDLFHNVGWRTRRL